MPSSDIPRRPFGRHEDERVSIMALGGYHLGSVATKTEAVRIVHAALDAGLTFMDNAWEYHEGKSEEWMGAALAGRRHEAFLMTKVCTHGRDRKVAMRQLRESLKRLRTDYLDLWQVHECVYANDPERHFATGGVIEALDEAKRSGMVRYVGFTGHKHPDIHLRMLSYDYPFDAAQMPLNPFDAHYASFGGRVVAECRRRGIAVLGMKSLGGDGDAVKKRVLTAAEGYRYAMSLPVATTVAGIDSMRILRQNLRIARGFAPMSAAEMRAIEKRATEVAADGRFELYKSTAKHEGEIGRKQHGFPSAATLAG